MGLKMKYLVGTEYKRRGPQYRVRTGPHCCNAGCGSNYKKTQKVIRKPRGEK